VKWKTEKTKEDFAEILKPPKKIKYIKKPLNKTEVNKAKKCQPTHKSPRLSLA